ncbi:MAG: lysophospholipid acyltransferase family protein [Nitriliruptorales bacterium]|nr:lysophospholipid acyltransferase family protein [Nitriliruptorales bacterium]
MPGMADAPPMYRFFKRVLAPMNRYLHLQVEGLENVPDSAPAILACNHLSFIDSICLPLNLDRPVYFIGKADYFDSWRTRWFFSGVGVVPIDRGGGDASQRALNTGVRILERGELLGIYPEGTRSPDGRLYRGKTGPVRMALEAGVPIIPCGVIGTDEAMPTGARVPKRHPVTVRYGKPLDLSRYVDRKEDPFALRSATDELMYEIMMLTGQEYVDEYASKVKSGTVDVDPNTITIDLEQVEAEADRRRAS